MNLVCVYTKEIHVGAQKHVLDIGSPFSFNYTWTLRKQHRYYNYGMW